MEHGKLGPFSLESALINQGQMGGSEVVIDLAHQSSAFHFARRPICSAAEQKKKSAAGACLTSREISKCRWA